MSPTTRKVLRTELLRSAAPVAAMTTLVLGALMMYSLADGWSGWPGRWMPFAASIRMSFLSLAPFAVACGAWQAGRERRRRIGEQLAAAARPSWQPLVATWAAVTLGATAGLLVVMGAGAALVAPVATYAGGGWWWLLAVAALAMAAMTAVGVALGRALPFRLTAPVAAIVTYTLLVYAVDDAGRLYGAEWLTPVLSYYEAPGSMLESGVSLLQALWFTGLAGTVLALAGGRRKWFAAVPAALAAAGAVPLLGGPPYASWELDPAARELVCTQEQDVCVARLEAFLLDDVTEPARAFLGRLDGIPQAPTRVVPMLNTDVDLDGRAALLLSDFDVDLLGRPVDPDWRQHFGWVLGTPCAGYEQLDAVAQAWAAQGAARFGGLEGNPQDVLLAMPENDQRAWVSAYVEATRTCDEEVLTELAEELR